MSDTTAPEDAKVFEDADEFSDVTNECSALIYSAMNEIARRMCAFAGKAQVECRPVLQGTVAAAIQFALFNGYSEEETRQMLTDIADTVIPQWIMAKAAQDAGNDPNQDGRA